MFVRGSLLLRHSQVSTSKQSEGTSKWFSNTRYSWESENFSQYYKVSVNFLGYLRRVQDKRKEEKVLNGDMVSQSRAIFQLQPQHTLKPVSLYLTLVKTQFRKSRSHQWAEEENTPRRTSGTRGLQAYVRGELSIV